MFIMTWECNQFFGPFKTERLARAWARFNNILAYSVLTNLPTYARLQSPANAPRSAVKQHLVAPSQRTGSETELKRKFSPPRSRWQTLSPAK